MQRESHVQRPGLMMFRSVSLMVAGVVAIGSCSKDALGPNGANVGSVVVAPATATVSVGANLTLSAEVLDGAGNVLESPHVSWASADASIADVSPIGVVTGRKVGTVLIAASSRGKDAFAEITVNPTPVATVRLSSTHASMLLGQTVQLVAQVLDGSGRVLTGRPVTWSSSDPDVATVTSTGMVTALAPGAAIVTASSEGRSAVASITVSLVPVAAIEVTPSTSNVVVGQTTQLSARLTDVAGNSITGRAITWASTRTTVATVSSEGVVTAVGSGTATITATSEGKTASATVEVSPRPATTVIVSPGTSTIFATQTVQLSALVTDDRGQVLTGLPVSFASSSNQVATISSSGLVTGIATGTVTITATSGAASGTATVTVAPDPVAAVEVSPPSASIIIGSTVQLVATPKNINGVPLTGRSVSWSSASPAVAIVSASGVVTGVAAGNAVIIATIDGKQGSALVTVRLVPVSTVTVTPATATLTTGQTISLAATPLDANGNPLAGRITGWSSSDNAIATVSSTGTVTGVAVGSAVITASIDGVGGTATVTVSPPAAASVTVAPATATLAPGQSVTLGATALDAGGNAITTATFTWVSADPAVATVSASGVVSGVAPGATTITASSGAATGSATVTVTSPPVNRVVVTPSNPRVDEGQTVQLTATAYDANNNVISGITFTWTSSNTNRATVSNTGLVSAIRDGNVTITATGGGKSGSTTVRVED